MRDFEEVYASTRVLSLSTFLDNEIGGMKKIGGTVRFSSCPWCGEGSTRSIRLSIYENDSKCHCHRCGEGGDIINTAMQLWGTSAWETALRLTGKSGSKVINSLPKRVIVPKAEEVQAEHFKAAKLREALAIIQQVTESFQDEVKCIDYLNIERGISIEIIKEAQRRKMLGFLPANPSVARKILIEKVGQELLMESGLWKRDAKASAIFFRPVIFFMPSFNAAEFRILGEPENDETPKSIRYGKNIQLPHIWRVRESARAMVVEGFIDMLSAVELGYTGHVIGMPGTNSWEIEWFQRLEARLSITKWFVAMDNDSEDDDEIIDGKVIGKIKNPGQTWAKLLQNELNKLNMSNEIRKLPVHHDINDLLRERKRAA